MARDSQQQRVYDAEDRLPRGKEYPTVRECQARVDQITQSAWWTKNIGKHTLRWRDPKGRWTVQVHNGAGHRRAVSYGGTIALPKWARCERVILHELAHEAMPRGEKHGPEFTRLLHDMLRRFMGVEVAAQFMVECAARGVKVKGKSLPRAKVTEAHREQVTQERGERRAAKAMGTYDHAIDNAREMVANDPKGDPVYVELVPGVGYMYGRIDLDTTRPEWVWGRRSVRALIYADGRVETRPEVEA